MLMDWSPRWMARTKRMRSTWWRCWRTPQWTLGSSLWTVRSQRMDTTGRSTTWHRLGGYLGSEVGHEWPLAAMATSRWMTGVPCVWARQAKPWPQTLRRMKRLISYLSRPWLCPRANHQRRGLRSMASESHVSLFN